MSLINWNQCRTFMLEYADRSRHHEFTQVKRSTVQGQLESALREHMRKILSSEKKQSGRASRLTLPMML